MKGISAAVGRSTHDDSYTAGVQAARQALDTLKHSTDVLIVFASPEYDHKLLMKGLVSVCGEVPMVGGTTAGELSPDGFSTGSVVILALHSDTLRFTTGIGHEMSRDESGCAESLINHLRSETGFDDALTLMVFPNGMGGDGVTVINGLYSALDHPVEIVGGFLGDGERFETTSQFYNGNVYHDSVTGLLISGNGSFRTGIGVRSGFESIGNRMVCTESEGNIVKKIDNINALDLYMELLGEERSKRLPGVCLEYPFGLIDQKVSIDGEEYFQLRCGLTVDKESRSITMAGSVPEGSAMTLTVGSRGDLINGASDAAEQAVAYLKDFSPDLAVIFSCVGRKIVLGRRVDEEVQAVKKVLGNDVPFIGLYTYGEIGPIDKSKETLSTTRFHNETLIIWVLGSERKPE